MDIVVHQALSASDAVLRSALVAAIGRLIATLNEHGADVDLEVLAERIARLAELLAEIDNSAKWRARRFGERVE